MDNLLFLGYEGLAALAPCALVFAAVQRHGRRSVSAGRLAAVALFALYVVGALHVTGAGTLYDALRFGLEWRPDRMNLIPFSQEIDAVGYALNVVLLMPLGALLPVLNGERCRLGGVLAHGFAFSLLIELSQLLNIRSTDVDDLILNTLGALLGYGLFRLFARATGWRPRGGAAWEPALYIAALFAGRFLLFDEFGLARLLYGF